MIHLVEATANGSQVSRIEITASAETLAGFVLKLVRQDRSELLVKYASRLPSNIKTGKFQSFTLADGSQYFIYRED